MNSDEIRLALTGLLILAAAYCAIFGAPEFAYALLYGAGISTPFKAVVQKVGEVKP